MKTKFKDLMLYTFAGIGICAILMATTNTPQQTTSTVPESHVWELIFAYEESGGGRVYSINKQTGEVRKYSKNYPNVKAKRSTSYVTMQPAN